jgi:hypothetical protein
MFMFICCYFIISRVMNLFMNVSVETCRDLLFIIDFRIASELHMDSSLRHVHLFASLQLFIIVALHVLSRSFSIVFCRAYLVSFRHYITYRCILTNFIFVFIANRYTGNGVKESHGY